MSRALKIVSGVDALLALIFGLPLLIVPGRLLTWAGWGPIDPIISRLFGAALLALGWSSFRGWQGAGRREVRWLLEMHLVFSVLACAGLARHLFVARYPLFPWLVFGLFVIFAVLWAILLLRKAAD